MNIFGASSIVLFFASLGFGLFVYSRNRASTLNRLWFLFSASVAVWGLSLYGVTSTNNLQTATYWQYSLDIAGILIPVFYFYFVSLLLGLLNNTQKVVITWAGLLLIILSFSTLFKIGMTETLGFFWISTGKLYFLFPFFFLILVLYSIYLLVRVYRSSNNSQLKQQIKYQLLGVLIGFGGGVTNFLPQLFDVFPFGNYFITLYVIFIGYSVINNQLFNIKTVAVELFAGGVSLVFLINLLTSETPRDWFMRFVFFLLALFFSFLIIRFVRRIEKLAEELDAANKGQENLIHTLSHQVKGGLARAGGMFSSILEGDYTDNSLKMTEMLAEALRLNKRDVASLEQTLLAFNPKFGTEAYEMVKFDFRDALLETVSNLKSDADDKKLIIDIHINEKENYEIMGDHEKITSRVLHNLIENTIIYTPTGGFTIDLHKTNDKILLTIKDTGTGITPEDMQILFTRGGHGKNSLKVNAHSIGDGLYLAKVIVEKHKGKIWAESEGAGKGAAFFVELPVKQD